MALDAATMEVPVKVAFMMMPFDVNWNLPLPRRIKHAKVFKTKSKEK